MAQATRKVSGTNMVEKQPKSRKAPAMVSGAAGSALAVVFIAAAEAVGRAIETQRTSRKEKLAQVMELDKANLVSFHKAMLDKAEEINSAMAQSKASNPLVKGLREYFELHPAQETVYVETSMWKRMALALDAGWKPELDMSWANIAAAATAALDSKGKPSNDPANPNRAGSNKRKAGRAATTPQQKAVTAVVSALKDDKGVKLEKNNRNLTAVIEGILNADGGATMEELTEVAAMIQRKLDAATAAAKAAKDATAKAAESSKQGKEKLAENQSKTSAGATVTRTRAVPSNRANTADKLIEQGKEITAGAPAARGGRRADAQA